ncbi:Peptidyl-tRNA hydrolase [Streptomyces sp. WMMB 714]|uniref:aminoacyl-tRNA hydrolase n=1 Tax=Streptomyces sp. WMMB 714 TaxID=1286822 RepID=UPI0008238A90|nr:aminoacyl-tRNA hydrolase [Streptomyces sp. WMMB 714]SCK43328.1 Peptidyl-tRNA hydrolase [Streptomyces sp. WMMB 714]
MIDAQDAQKAADYALPLVVRLERDAPPALTDALETAARAVLTLLADERSAPGRDFAEPGTAEGEPGTAGAGEWAEAVRRWEQRDIRKVVRRARGAEWRRAQALPGITVTGGTASVRVFPPVPVDGWPKDLSRLQVSGTVLDDAHPPARPVAGTAVLWMAPGLEMSAGKAMAQAAHGAQLAWWRLPSEDRAAWAATGFALAVRRAPDRAEWERLVRSGLPVVQDAGHTEIAPGTCTVVADHPALDR